MPEPVDNPDAEIYLAGPDGFTLPGRLFHKNLQEELHNRNYRAISPWNLAEDTKALLGKSYAEEKKFNETVYSGNKEHIERVDLVLARLDGVQVDDGTGFEIAYAEARNTPVIGYRTDFREAGDNPTANVNIMIDESIDAFIDTKTRNETPQDEFDEFVDEVEAEINQILN